MHACMHVCMYVCMYVCMPSFAVASLRICVAVMMHPDRPQSDALHCHLPCEAFDFCSNLQSSQPFSKAARRQQRAKRSALRALGVSSPPGLSSTHRSTPSIKVLPENPSAEYRSEFVELSRRVQRIELLLFNASTDAFTKLDEHIADILSGDCERGGDEDSAIIHSVTGLPESCEVFCLSEGDPLPNEDGLIPKDALDAKVCSLEVSHENLLGQMTQLQSSCAEMQASREKLVNEVVCGVQGLITSRVGAVENTVASLSNIADTHTKQINKVIDKNERLVQMLEAMVVNGEAGAQPAASQNAHERKTKARK
jgi:hypothetical protein